MPSFDGRRRELRAALATAMPALGTAEGPRIAGVLEDYLNARDAVLTMVEVVLTDDRADPVANDFNGKWRDMVRAAQDRLDNMLSGVTAPSAAAVRLREETSFAEMAFWSLLGSLRLAEARDSIAADVARVREEISVLDKRWQSLSEEDLRIEDAEQKAAQDLKDLLDQKLAEAMPLWIQIGSAVLALKDAWKGFGKDITDHAKAVLIGAGVPEPIVNAILTVSGIANDFMTPREDAAKLGLDIPGYTASEAYDWINRVRALNLGGYIQYRIGGVLDPTTKAVLSLLDAFSKPVREVVEGGYASRIATWKANLDNEGVLIVSYGGIRQQVDDFLKKTNLDGIRATHAAILADMDRVGSGLRTDGQKSDWSEVQRSLKDSLTNRKTDAEKAFEDFYRANTGRFLGGISTETERTLLEPEKWQVTTQGVIAVGLDQRLREWRQQVMVIQAGPQDAFDSVQDAFAGLPLIIRDQFQDGVNSYFKQQMATLNGEADKTIQLLESSALMVNAQKISDDMDRRRLSEALRATVR